MRVYLIGAYRPRKAKPDAVKIGVALDVNKRLAGIQTGNHLECRIIAAWTVSSPRAAISMERHAHYVFRRERLNGEWFKPLITRYVDFLNTKLVEDKEHGIRTQDAHIQEQVDLRIVAENPWLSVNGGAV